MKEQQVQSKKIKELEAQGYYVIKLTMTNKNGIPDLLAIPRDSDVIFIEVKATNGKLSKCAARVSGGLPAASGGGSYWHVAAQGRFFTETALRRFCARISHRAVPATRRTALSCRDAADAAAPPCSCHGASWHRGAVWTRWALPVFPGVFQL